MTRCARCDGVDDVIVGDGPPICRRCVDVCTVAAAGVVDYRRGWYDDTVRFLDGKTARLRGYSEDRG